MWWRGVERLLFLKLCKYFDMQLWSKIVKVSLSNCIKRRYLFADGRLKKMCGAVAWRFVAAGVGRTNPDLGV